MKLGFIGAGNMASAIIGGVLRAELLPPEEIGVYDVSAEAMARCREKGLHVFGSIAEIGESCEYILLAVKPQSFAAVLSELKPSIEKNAVVISIAAGITHEAIKKSLGFDCKIVRVMPNTPLLLGAGATALARVNPTSPEEFAFVERIFSAAGVTGEIPAEKMNEIIPVNGSSPAFIYYFAKVMVDCAQKLGIDPAVAMRLFCQSLRGSADMLELSGNTPDELIRMVCSPGGTTLAGMQALEENGFGTAVEAYFDACVKRAGELAQ